MFQKEPEEQGRVIPLNPESVERFLELLAEQGRPAMLRMDREEVTTLALAPTIVVCNGH